jgi:hypothetical protein
VLAQHRLAQLHLEGMLAEIGNTGNGNGGC